MAFIEPVRSRDLPDAFTVRESDCIEFIYSFSKTLNVMTEKYINETAAGKVCILTSFLDNGPTLLHFRVVTGERRVCDVRATIEARENAFIPGMDRRAIDKHFSHAPYILRVDMPLGTMLPTYGHGIHTRVLAILQDAILLACTAVRPEFVASTMVICAVAGSIGEEDEEAINASDVVMFTQLAKRYDLEVMSCPVRLEGGGVVLEDYFTYMYGPCEQCIDIIVTG